MDFERRKRSSGPGPIERFMSSDHVHLARLFARVERAGGVVDIAAYGEFRARLLAHIAMEEKVLLPVARACPGGVPLPIERALRDGHAQLTKLLRRGPSHRILALLREAIVSHNAIEEGPSGLYASCDALAGVGLGGVMAKLRAVAHAGPGATSEA